MRRAAARSFIVATACLALTGATACSFLKSIVGANTVDLEGADVKSMGVDIRKQQKTICPRERVQMAVFMEAKLKDEEAAKKLETWEGTGIMVNKNDKLDFSEFAFHSDLGGFDDEGFFSPNKDLLASIDKEFELTAAFKKRPDKFTMKTKYKPDYGCISGGGAEGDAGNQGSAGSAGSDGSSGSSGADGGDAGSGGPGGDGSDGGAGPKLTVYATMVKTPFYDKLIAVKIDGPASDFLLFPPEASITIRATGGPGGSGGTGGRGGRGGSGGSGAPGGNGGKGGAGGNGGKGGNGGPGGQIELIFDGKFAEIENAIKLDVSGGPGGAAGPAGAGGSGGTGGTGNNGAPSGKNGADGPGGGAGTAGQDGPKGTASAKSGKAAAKFEGISGVTPL
ncbi:MAG: hypothetical protein IT372_00355 [Polyangiaceae bacterium]|nr:hypothetical protein [Polyangiaceae bacterium]